jgi:hypothetical protein
VGNTSNQNGSNQGSSSLKASEISLSSASAALGEPVSSKAVLKDSSGSVLNGKVVEMVYRWKVCRQKSNEKRRYNAQLDRRVHR